jgi:DNA repair exonuclease SbcCD ATPase subunit
MVTPFQPENADSIRRGMMAMTMKTRSGGRLAIVAVVATMILAAPAVWAQKEQQKSAENIQQFRASVVGIKTQIGTTIEALNGVVQSANGGDTKAAFKKYSDQIKAMDKQIQKTKGYAQKMKEQGAAYFKAWEEKMGAVTNEEMKAKAAARRTELQAQYDQIQAGIEEAKTNSGKFWQDLQDLQKYYASDLSPKGIAGTADLVTKTTADSKTIEGYMDKVVAGVDQVLAEFGVAPKTT